MAYKIEKVDVWSGPLVDRPGALAAKLESLREAGANLEFVLARRDRPGKGLLFVAPLKGAAQLRAAKRLRLAKSARLKALRVEGPDRAGLGAKMTAALAAADINLRGISAVAVGRRGVFYISFDGDREANQAGRVLRRAL